MVPEMPSARGSDRRGHPPAPPAPMAVLHGSMRLTTTLPGGTVTDPLMPRNGASSAIAQSVPLKTVMPLT